MVVIRHTSKDVVFYLRTNWRGRAERSSFTLSVTDGTTVWESSAGPGTIKNKLWPQDLIELPKYIELTQRALTHAPGGKEFSFQFSFVQGDGVVEKDDGTCNLRFAWQINFASPPAKFQIDSSMLLNRCTVDTAKRVAGEMYDWLIEERRVFDREARRMKNATSKLRRQRKGAIADLEKLVNEKTAMERTLYSRFARVLNEKKKRIRELEERIKKQEGERAIDPPPPVVDAMEDAQVFEHGPDSEKEEENPPRRRSTRSKRKQPDLMDEMLG